MTTSTIALDKILGSLWGGATGDAMGGPLEPFSPEVVRQRFGDGVTTLVDYLDEGPDWYSKGAPRGTYTDDTLLRNVLCLAIIRQQGRIDARRFAAVYVEQMKPEHFVQGKLWPGEAVVYFKLLAAAGNPGSIAYWPDARAAGQGNLPACDAAMIMGPIGLINAGDPRQAFLDAIEVGGVLQSGPSVAAAAAVAAAVAEAMRPEATPDAILDAGLGQLESETAERIGRAVQMATAAGSPAEFKRRFHATMLTKVADALEVVPAAFGILRATSCAVVPSMVQGANFGRDCDSIATIAGSIAGAFEGANAIPQAWKDLVRAANSGQPNVEELGIGLHDALLAEQKRCAGRLRLLEALLSPCLSWHTEA